MSGHPVSQISVYLPLLPIVEKLYDFEAAGTGAYSIAANTNFQLAGSDDVVNSVGDLAKVEVPQAEAVTVNISGDVARRERVSKGKRATVSCSNATQKSFITASCVFLSLFGDLKPDNVLFRYTEGKALASGAVSYISSNGANSLYTAYYKTNPTSTVSGKFSAVASESSSSRTLNCSDPYGGKQSRLLF